MNREDKCGRRMAAFREAKSYDMKKGFTLIEAVMSLALFMILSFGVLLLWQHVSRSAQSAISTQNALDNLGIAMDGLLTNIELSHTITLHTNNQNILSRLELRGLDHLGRPHTYHFTFDPNARYSSAGYKSLRLGMQVYAYGIESIHIINFNNSNRRLDITITSVCLCLTPCARAHINQCESRVSITGSANIMHKHITN